MTVAAEPVIVTLPWTAAPVWGSVVLVSLAAVGALSLRWRSSGDAESDGGGVVLDVHGLSVSRGRTTIVRDVSLSIGRGRVVVLAGRNGAGKTSLLAALCGLITPSSGFVRVLGHRIEPGSKGLEYVGASVAGSGFLPHRTVRQNLDDLWTVVGRPSDAVNIDDVLERCGLRGVGEVRASTLSQGSARRLCTAMAMLGTPPLLILDEPFSGLDIAQRTRVGAMLRKYARDGGTVVITAHEVEDIERCADDVIAVTGGTVQQFTGSMSELDSIHVVVDRTAELGIAESTVPVGPSLATSLTEIAESTTHVRSLRTVSSFERWFHEVVRDE